MGTSSGVDPLSNRAGTQTNYDCANMPAWHFQPEVWFKLVKVECSEVRRRGQGLYYPGYGRSLRVRFISRSCSSTGFSLFFDDLTRIMGLECT